MYNMGHLETIFVGHWTLYINKKKALHTDDDSSYENVQPIKNLISLVI